MVLYCVTSYINLLSVVCLLKICYTAIDPFSKFNNIPFIIIFNFKNTFLTI